MVSCSSDSSDVTDNNSNEGKYFAVGIQYGKNKANNFAYMASIWVDGVPTNLSNTVSYSTADAIALNDNDIYVVGTETADNNNVVLKLWKNNVGKNITDGAYRVQATDIVVNQGNVYIAGNEYLGLLNSPIATIWRNGQAIRLTTDVISEVNAVYVYGNDIYAAGYKMINDKKTAITWKNGVETILYSEDDDLESIATDIYADDSGIYVTGAARNSDKSTAILWKNTVATPLSNPEVYTEAKALFVQNSDVYVCGHEINTDNYQFTGRIWKNGNLIDEIANGHLESICIKENKIYTGGTGLDDEGMDQEGKIWESDLETLDFTAKYKFTANAIKAVLVK